MTGGGTELGIGARLGRDAWVFAALALLALFAALYVGSRSSAHAPDTNEIEGHDFVSFYAAGRLSLDGTPERAYRRAPHEAVERAVARDLKGGDGYTDYVNFAYPPVFLVVLAPIAALPYLPALAVWLVGTGLVYLAALRRIRPGWRTLLAGVAFPNAFFTVIYGQNGFLSAGLAGLGLAVLERRPWLGGFLIGLLAYKPQLALAFPVVLIASARWRAVGGATAGLGVSVALSLALFGLEPWRAVLAAAADNRVAMLDQTEVLHGKLQSVFGMLRYAGASVTLAYAAHGAFALTIAAVLAAVWRGPAAYELKAAAALVGTLLLTPYSLPYDLMLLAPAMAFLVAHADRTGRRTADLGLLAVAAVAPAITTLAFQSPLYLAGPLGLLILFVGLVARASPATAPEAAKSARTDGKDPAVFAGRLRQADPIG